MKDTLQSLNFRYVQPYTKGRAIPPCVSVAPLNVSQAVEAYWTNAVMGAYNPHVAPEDSLPLPPQHCVNSAPLLPIRPNVRYNPAWLLLSYSPFRSSTYMTFLQ